MLEKLLHGARLYARTKAELKRRTNMNFENFWKEALRGLVSARWAKCEPAIKELHKEFHISFAMVEMCGSSANITTKIQNIYERMQEICHKQDIGLYIGITWNPPQVCYVPFAIDPKIKAKLETQFPVFDTNVGH